IVAVTFTNKAAQEMRERARRLLGGAALPGFVGTFHAFGLRFLRRSAGAARLDPRFAIADGADQLALVKQAMAEAGVSYRALSPGEVRSRISQAKNALVTPAEFEATQTDFAGERIGRVYRIYERRLATSGALDFDDLIVRPVRLLRGNE